MEKVVTYIFPTSHHYRLPFHKGLREELSKYGIEYRVIYCDPVGSNIDKKDTVDIEFGKKVKLYELFGIRYQAAWKDIIESDLVIIQQENKLLLNYMCQILGMAGVKRVAFFGHGKNFQALNPNSISENWKKFWAKKVDWWFAYTEKSENHLLEIGYPKDRITVFNNAIDISSIVNDINNIDSQDRQLIKESLGINSENVGIYIGGIYREKRPEFLLEAALKVREKVDDFHLVVVGGGSGSSLVEKASRDYPWVHYLGPKFGSEKAALASISSVYLMPGLVGLGVLDSFVYKTPIVTTSYPYHSPEIAYLENGQNGVITVAENDVDEYAQEVIKVLVDDLYREKLVRGGEEALAKYNIENMVSRFASGVLQSLRV